MFDGTPAESNLLDVTLRFSFTPWDPNDGVPSNIILVTTITTSYNVGITIKDQSLIITGTKIDFARSGICCTSILPIAKIREFLC